MDMGKEKERRGGGQKRKKKDAISGTILRAYFMMRAHVFVYSGCNGRLSE